MAQRASPWDPFPGCIDNFQILETLKTYRLMVRIALPIETGAETGNTASEKNSSSGSLSGPAISASPGFLSPSLGTPHMAAVQFTTK